MIREEEERAALEVLLAHEEQRRARRGKRHRRRDAQGVRRETVAECAIPDLVVVLREHDQPLRRTAVAGQLARELLERAEARVVALALARQQDMQVVVRRVVPLRVVPPFLDRAPVAHLHLGDDERARTLGVHAPGELGEDVRLRLVEDRVHRVEAKPVDVVVVDPHQRVLNRPFAHGSLRVVDRVAPEGLVPVGEVRAEGAQCLASGPDVVVDDVEDDAEAFRVRSVD